MGNVSLIKEAKRDPDPRIVACLEKLLSEARAGEITDFAYVVNQPTTTDFGWHGRYFELLALIEWLKFKMHKALDTEK